jgi:hypothetical protein
MVGPAVALPQSSIMAGTTEDFPSSHLLQVPLKALVVATPITDVAGCS